MSDVETSQPELWTEIKELEQREADAMLRADVSMLGTLWSDELLVNSTANLIADKEILLGVIANGRLRLRLYSRLTIRAVTAGDSVITTGNERSQLDGTADGMILLCSYMNSWIKRDLSWQLLGRHVGLISQVPSDTAGAVI
jgi:small basic protein